MRDALSVKVVREVEEPPGDGRRSSERPGSEPTAKRRPEPILRAAGLVLVTLLLAGASCDVGGGDFDLVLNQPNVSVAPGASVDVPVSVERTGGFAGQVDLRAEGVPSGSTIAFSPASASTGSVATVTTTEATEPGTYSIAVHGESGALARSASFALQVTPLTPGFEVALDPTRLTLQRGASDDVALSVTTTGGFDGAVDLRAEDVPNGVTLTFSPNPATTSSVVSVAADASAPSGTSVVTVRGTSGGLADTDVLTLDISDPPAEIEEVTIVGIPGAREVRQGVGMVELIARGRGLDDASNPRLVEAGIDGVVDPDNANNTSVRMSFEIPHGVANGPQTLSIDLTDIGPVTSSEAIVITPIVADPDGSSGGRGTFESPFDVQTAVDSSDAGDTVFLTAGEHVVDADLTVKDGTRLEGEGPESELQGAGALNNLRMEVVGEVSLADFTLSGFGYGMRFDGMDVVDVEGIVLEQSRLEGLYIDAGATAVIRDSVFTQNQYEAIHVHGDAQLTIIDSESSENGGSGIKIHDLNMEDYKNVVIQGMTISDNLRQGIAIQTASGHGNVKVRDTTIERNHLDGIIIYDDMDVLDFGTADDPGGNVLRNNRLDGPQAYWELHDYRPDRAADGPIVEFVGNTIEGESFSTAGLAVGADSYDLAGVRYWKILGFDNRIRFSGP